MEILKKISQALDDLAHEFGGSLQFKTMQEFDDFMLDDSQSFILIAEPKIRRNKQKREWKQANPIQKRQSRTRKDKNRYSLGKYQ